MSEIANRATELYVPDLAYPKPLAKVIAAYEEAHTAWREEYAAVVAADAAVNLAPELDQAALVAAVAAGKPLPGLANEQIARAELTVAEERCRVAREAATAQTDVLRAAMSAATEELVPIVLEGIRKAAAAYDAETAAAKERVITARRTLISALTATRMVKPFIADHYGVTTGLPENVEEPTWKPPVAPTIDHQLAYLEQHIAAGRKARATAKAGARATHGGGG